MILRSSPLSPFGRKVKIAAAVLGLKDRITVEMTDTLDPQENESIQITRNDGRVFIFEFISDAGAALENEPDANTEVRAVVADLAR